MTLLGAQRTSAYLGVGAGLGAAWISGEIALPYLLGSTLALVASWFVGERTSGKYAGAWTAGLAAFLLFLAFQWITGRLDIVVAVTVFALLLSVYFSFNRGDVAGYARLQLVSLLLILGGAALSADLLFGVFFAIYGVASTWSMSLNQLREEVEEEAKQNAVPDGGRSVLTSHRLITARFLGVLGALSAGALVMAVVVFVMFPRVSFNLWQRRGNLGEPRTGFSDTVQLGQVGLIKNDTRIAFRFTPPSNVSRAEHLDLHWRGAVFDTWDGTGWGDSGSRQRPARQDQDLWYRVRGKRGDAKGDVREWAIELAPDPEGKTLFTLPGTRRVRVPPKTIALRTVPGPGVFTDLSGDLAFGPPQATELPYVLQVEEQPSPVDVPAGSQVIPEDGARWVTLPEVLDPRIVELSQRLTKDKGRISAVDAVERHLAPYRYSLANEPQGPDPLASFLFDVKAGHCEYFATAMVVLLRASGIPARLVTGFYGGAYVENGAYYVIRQGDAHAWVEVWYPEVGWLTHDPTPPDARPATLETAWGRFQLWLDGVREQWRRNVVDYDIFAQVQGLKSLVDVAKEASQRLGNDGPSTRWSTVLRRFGGVLVALVLVVGFLVWWRSRTSSGNARPKTESQRRAARLLAEVERVLAKRGVTRGPVQTEPELLDAARAAKVQGVDRLAPVVARSLEARYGRRALAAEEFERLRREVHEA